MQGNVHSIRTFELNTEWKKLKKKWEFLTTRSGFDWSTKEKFINSYLPSVLGEELSINETRGVRCIRIFFNEDDEIISLFAFSKSGYMDLHLNFDFIEKKDDDKREPIEEESSEDVFTHVFREDLFDVQNAITRLSDNTREVLVHEDKYLMLFKKIPISPYDVYMKDPVWLYYSVTGIPGRFYEYGYKMTEVTHKYIDGIISSTKRYFYDSNGMLLKKIFMCGTPWGGIVEYGEELWNYNLPAGTVTVRVIDIKNNALEHLFEYKLDKMGIIVKRMDYEPFESRKSACLAEKDKLELTRILHYEYGENEKLGRIKSEFCKPRVGFDRLEFEYDVQGRLIAQRDYDENNILVNEDKYSYISDTRVEVTCSVFLLLDKYEKGTGKEI